MWDWFYGPLAGQTWWDILNSGIVTTSLSGIVGLVVALRVREVAIVTQAKQDGDRDQGKAEFELGIETEKIAAPEEPPVPPASVDPQYKNQFHRASAAIRALKDYVDTRANRVKDGRTRRKYENISRRDYRIIITTLGHDGGFGPGELKELLDAFERWRSFRTGRQPVSEKVAGEYEALAQKYKVTPSKPEHWRPERARMVQW